MNKIYQWYNGLSKRIRDSIIISMAIVGAISTVFSILGISLRNLIHCGPWLSIGIVVAVSLLILFATYIIIGAVFRNCINTTIKQTSVSVSCGDIFEATGLRVIGCDTHFDTRIDDIVISKKSLHGQFVLEHGNKDEIEAAVANEATRLCLQKNDDGLYDFPIGTIVRYDSKVDGHTYLLLAMSELTAEREAHTDMAKFELMLMKMWKEIDRVYALNDVALPLIGTGISRFDDGPKRKEDILRCMLCTLNSSGVTLKSKVKILIDSKTCNLPLYEYRSMFQSTLRR